MQPTEVGATEWLANLSIGYVVMAACVLTALRLILVPSRAPIARSVAELVESLIIAGVLVFLIIRPFFLQAFFIPSESMEPTLMGHDHPTPVHDHIFVDKLSYRLREPKRGEIIVFRAEKKADKGAEMEGRQPVENVLIKRLVAVPGDKLEIKEVSDGKLHLFVNDRKVTESYLKEEMDASRMDSANVYGYGEPLKLRQNEYFVMGDNRNNSNDSRFWGALPRERVIGRAMLIFWPLNRIRLIH